ncbi:MAG: diadenylate cyclase CdaA [Clostridia bacterium]|nr:diadenylate cyclase CdaA [Clostridia bacterium]
MDKIFDTLYTVFNQISYAISNISFFDFVDIAILSYIIFKSIGFLKETRAGQLVKGLLILFVVYIISIWWDLVTVKWLLSNIMEAALIAAVVIFQPELRRILEKVGRTNFARGQMFESEDDALSICIDHISKAAATMQENKIGALIVFENRTQLGEIISTGTVINAEASPSMINNVFFPKSPLHDGAMIIRDGRLYAAGCILPLTQREDISLQLGTRHRAAIGMTENSDAVVLVISEETGTISIAVDGQITRDYNAVSAGAELKRLLLTAKDKENNKFVSNLIDKVKNIKFKKESGKEPQDK